MYWIGMIWKKLFIFLGPRYSHVPNLAMIPGTIILAPKAMYHIGAAPKTLNPWVSVVLSWRPVQHCQSVLSPVPKGCRSTTSLDPCINPQLRFTNNHGGGSQTFWVLSWTNPTPNFSFLSLNISSSLKIIIIEVNESQKEYKIIRNAVL